MDIKEAFESVNDFSQAKNNGEPYPRQAPASLPIHVWVDSVQSEFVEMAVAKNLVEQIDAAVDAMYYTADFAACCGMKMLDKHIQGKACKKEEVAVMDFGTIEQLRSALLTAALPVTTDKTTLEELEDIVCMTFASICKIFTYNTGIDPLDFFEIVHTANMRKINPETRTAYVYKDNGNIGKPAGFVGPEKEIQAKAEALGLCVI